MSEPPKIYGIIYRIVNLENYKSYIGQTRSHYLIKGKYKETGMNFRWGRHKASAKKVLSLKKNKRRNCCYKLGMAITTYNVKNFIIKEICKCELIQLNQLEIFYIKVFDSIKNGYNAVAGGSAVKKVGHTDETKRILSDRTKKFYSNIDNRIEKSNIKLEYEMNKMIEKYLKLDIEYILLTRDKDRRVILRIKVKDNPKKISSNISSRYMNFSEILQRAMKFSEAVVDKSKIIISKTITNPIKKIKDYKNIISINMKYRSLYNNDLIVLEFLLDNNSKTKTKTFGSKLKSLNEKIEMAKIFINEVRQPNTKITYTKNSMLDKIFALQENPKALETKQNSETILWLS